MSFNLPPPPVAADDFALLEAGGVAQNKLHADAEAQEHGRAQRLKNAVLNVILLNIYTVGLIVCWAILAVAWDTLVTEEARYLTRDQVSLAKAFLGVVLISGLFADYGKRLISR